jgi:hypothetical protein
MPAGNSDESMAMPLRAQTNNSGIEATTRLDQEQGSFRPGRASFWRLPSAGTAKARG